MRPRGIELCSVVLVFAAACGGGGLDRVTASVSAHSAPTENRTPTVEEQQTCDGVLQGIQQNADDAVAQYESGEVDAAGIAAQVPWAELTTMLHDAPESILTHTRVEATVMRQLIDGERPDLDAYRQAVAALRRLCGS